MKKLLVLLLCVFCLAGCVPNLMTVAQIAEKGETFATERLEGCSRERLRKAWGDPQRESEDGFSDVWFLDEAGEKRITVRYDEHDKVVRVLETVPGQGGVPARPSTDEPTCIAPITPTDPSEMNEAPDLTVFCSGKEITAMSGGLTWCTTMPDGTPAVICADALHPLEMQKYLTVLETPQNCAGLAFWDGETQVFPGEIAVTAWDFDCTPDCDGLPNEVAVYSGGEMIDLLPGKYIYIVNTKWGDGVTSGGSVTHVFCAERLYPHNE